MALLDLWENSPDIRKKSVQQIIAISGDGKLIDGSTTSTEFRELLANIESKYLTEFSSQCLNDKNKKFDVKGFALQDIVNEIGKRLDFEVTPGRYRGVPNIIGFDGLWKSGSGESIVVETKTTSVYSIDLQVVANYKKRLIEKGQIPPEKTSILLIVGRFDTGGLEAQIRGSKFAWDIRLISIEGLVKLLYIKENLDDPHIITKIREILIPKEYTKVDGIIDLVFSTTEDLKYDLSEEIPLQNGELFEKAKKEKPGKTPKFIPVSFHQECINKAQKKLKITLVKESRVTFKTPDNKIVILCAVSKVHQKKTNGPNWFWFAFQIHQKERLAKVDESYLLLGCGSSSLTFLIPIQDFLPWLEKMNITKIKNGVFWHLHIQEKSKEYQFITKKGMSNISLDKYKI